MKNKIGAIAFILLSFSSICFAGFVTVGNHIKVDFEGLLFNNYFNRATLKVISSVEIFPNPANEIFSISLKKFRI